MEENKKEIENTMLNIDYKSEKWKSLKIVLGLLHQIKDPCKHIMDGTLDGAVSILKQLYICKDDQK